MGRRLNGAGGRRSLQNQHSQAEPGNEGKTLRSVVLKERKSEAIPFVSGLRREMRFPRGSASIVASE